MLAHTAHSLQSVQLKGCKSSGLFKHDVLLAQRSSCTEYLVHHESVRKDIVSKHVVSGHVVSEHVLSKCAICEHVVSKHMYTLSTK